MRSNAALTGKAVKRQPRGLVKPRLLRISPSSPSGSASAGVRGGSAGGVGRRLVQPIIGRPSDRSWSREPGFRSDAGFKNHQVKNADHNKAEPRPQTTSK